MAEFQDVLTRFMPYRWVNRYRILSTLLRQDWPNTPTFLHRILLTQTAELLRLCSMELQYLKDHTEYFDAKLRESKIINLYVLFVFGVTHLNCCYT